MKKPFAAVVGTVSLLAGGVASAQQNGNMMGGGGMWGGSWMGGYGGMGIWVPILVVALIAGLVIWAVKQKGK
jgi:hypothetical protein